MALCSTCGLTGQGSTAPEADSHKQKLCVYWHQATTSLSPAAGRGEHTETHTRQHDRLLIMIAQFSGIKCLFTGWKHWSEQAKTGAQDVSILADCSLSLQDFFSLCKNKSPVFHLIYKRSGLCGINQGGILEQGKWNHNQNLTIALTNITKTKLTQLQPQRSKSKLKRWGRTFKTNLKGKKICINVTTVFKRGLLQWAHTRLRNDPTWSH